MLIQFVVTYDQLLNTTPSDLTPGVTTLQAITSGQTSNANPATVVVNTSLYGGKYVAKIASFQVRSGAINTTTYEKNPQLINISSSKFLLPANANRFLSFVNHSFDSLPDVSGSREILLDSINGTIDLTISINQYGSFVGGVDAVVSPYTINKTQTWGTANFGFIVLVLDVCEYNDQVTFATINKKTFE
jgi:hypothetical protein